MRVKSMLCSCFLVTVAMAMTGCKSGQQVLPATSHAPGDPKLVKFYEKAPAQYEVLGPITLDVAPDASWDDRGNANKGFMRFQESAAKMGGNGVLLNAPPAEQNLLVGAGFNGTMYHVPMKVEGEKRTALGQAIFVHKEE